MSFQCLANVSLLFAPTDLINWNKIAWHISQVISSDGGSSWTAFYGLWPEIELSSTLNAFTGTRVVLRRVSARQPGLLGPGLLPIKYLAIIPATDKLVHIPRTPDLVLCQQRQSAGNNK